MVDILGEYSGGTVARIKEGVSEKCNVKQALDLERGLQERVGHVLAITVAGAALTKDLSVEDPMITGAEEYVPVVGVIELVEWAGGRRDPLELTCWISASNWQKIAQVEHTEDDGAADDEELAECAMSFVVYDYDPLKKKTYKSFHTNNVAVKGLFRFDGKDIVVGRTPHEAIKSPQVYQLKLCAKPKPPQQDLQVGLAAMATQTKPWGETAVAAALAEAKREKERISRKVEEKRRAEEEKRAKIEERNAAKKEEEEAEKREAEAKEAEARRVKELADKEAKLKEESDRLAAEAAELEKKAKAAEESASAEEAARLATEAAEAAERRQAVEETRIAEEFDERESKLRERFDKLVAEAEGEYAKSKEAARKAYEAAETAALEAEVLKAEEAAKLKRAKKTSEAAALESEIVKAQGARTRARLERAREEEARDAALAERKAFIAKERDAEEDALREEKSERLRTFETAREAAQELRRRLQTKAEVERHRREEAQRKAEARRQEADRARTDALVAKGGAEGKKVFFEALMKAEKAAAAAERAERLAKESRGSLDRQGKRLEALERDIDRARGVAEALAQAARRREFRQDMSISLKITIDGTTTEVPGGSVSTMTLELETYGFKGEIEFMVTLDKEDDALVSSFSGTRTAEVEIELKSKFQPASSPPDPLKVKGIVLERTIVEDSFDALAEEKVLRRRYWMSFADPAYVLWRQHLPCELFNEATLQAVVDAHKGQKITITGQWPGHWDLSKKFIFLGLGDPKNASSFYDFLIWYLDRHFGVLTYDATTNAYAIAAAKPDAGTAKPLDADDAERIEIGFPEVPRYAASVLNGWSEAGTKKKEIAFDDAVAGIRQDHLVRTEITSDFDAKGKVETARLVARKPEARVLFARFPTITFTTGSVVDFTAAGWSADVFTKSKTYRARSFRVRMRSAASPDKSAEKLPFGEFLVEAEAVLEDTEDTVPHLPPYRAPRYPVLVEGKVVSEEGEEKQETYQIYKDSKTSIDQYKVKVPLFADKTVLVDFNPNTLHGHFYFPAFKNARVLLAIEYDRAWIKRFLDWRPGARLPADGQGNHLLLGKSETSQTSINHVYVDDLPVLNVKRLQEKDTQTIQLMDGKLTIEVKEEKE